MKPKQSILSIHISFIAIIFLIVLLFGLMLIKNSYIRYERASHIVQISRVSEHFFNAVRNFGFERGRLNVVMNYKGNPDDMKKNISFFMDRRIEGEDNLRAALGKIKTSGIKISDKYIKDLSSVQKEIYELRKVLDAEIDKNYRERDRSRQKEWFEKMSLYISKIIRLSSFINTSTKSIDSKALYLLKLGEYTTKLRDHAGPVCSFLAAAILSPERFNDEKMYQIIARASLAKHQFEQIRFLSEALSNEKISNQVDKLNRIYNIQFQQMINSTLQSMASQKDFEYSQPEFTKKAVASLEEIANLMRVVSVEERAYLLSQKKKALTALIANIAILAFVLFVLGYSISVVQKTVYKPLSDIAGKMKKLIAGLGGESIELTKSDRNDEIGDIENLLFEYNINKTLLYDEKQKFRNIFTNAAVGLARVAADGRFIEVNDNYCSITGYDKQKLLDMTFQEITHPDDLEKDLEFMKNVLSGEQKKYSRTKRCFKSDGSIIWVLLNVSLVRNGKNEPDYFIFSVEDITERIEKEEEFKALSHELSLIFNNSLTGVIWVAEGRIVQRANQRAADILGYEDPEELIGKAAVEFHISEESCSDFGARFYDVLVNKDIESIEYELKKKNGETVWVTISGKAIDENTPVDLSKGVIWTFDDLSVKKALESKVLKEKRKFENLFRHHSAIMFIVDPENGRIMDANDAAVDFYKYSYAELTSIAIHDINPMGQNEIIKRMSQVVNDEVKSFVFQHRKKDGSMVYVEAFSTQIYLEDRTLLFSVVHDITERIKDEEQIRIYQEELRVINEELEERVIEETHKRIQREMTFQQLFDSLDFMVAMVGCDHHYIAVNSTYLNHFAKDEKDIVGHHVSEIIGVEEYKVLESIAEKAFNGETVHVERKIYSLDGEEMFIDSTFTPYYNEDNEILGAIVISQNITEARKLKNDLEKKEQLMIQQSKLADMGSMIGAIAHQWKQPLNVIGLSVSLYEEEHEGDSGVEELAREINGQVAYMSETINDFRNFFQPSKRKQMFDINEAVNNVIKLLYPKMKTQNINIHLDKDIDAKAYGFKNEFMQVMMNLINNARDAVVEREPKNGIIHIDVKKNNDFVTISLKDNGGGISEELLPDKLFEQYVTSKGDKGTGIGLSMSKTIIEKYMDGVLTARNIKDGAEFTIMLPIKEDKFDENNLRDATILVVEDDEFTSSKMKELLEKVYTHVLVARNGEEGLQLFQENADEISLIITDVDMPKMNGIDMSRKIRKFDRSVPIIVTTDIKQDVFEDVGFSDIFDKPVPINKLVESINKLIFI